MWLFKLKHYACLDFEHYNPTSIRFNEYFGMKQVKILKYAMIILYWLASLKKNQFHYLGPIY